MVLKAALAVAGLLIGTEALLALAAAARAPLTFDVGPSTGGYVAGFTPSEERPPSTFRWSRRQSRIEVPLAAGAGRGTLRLRAARFLDRPARVYVFAWGRPVATLAPPSGGYRIHSLPLPASPGPLTIELLTDDPELGLALDWVRIEGLSFRLPMRAWHPRLLVAGSMLLALFAGFRIRGALVVAAAVAVSAAAWAATDPFALAHVSALLAVPALALSGAVAAIVRRKEGGRWLVLVFLAGHLLKGAALFHPAYFYNDVRNNLRYAMALREGGGPLAKRNQAAQERVGVAYPRIVAGRKYAFPYSPLFFLPFGSLPEERIVDAMKQVVLAAAAAAPLVVFALARLAGGAGAGLAAAVVAAMLPPLYSRLLLAMWSTVVGHLLDLLVVLAAALVALRPSQARRWAAQAAALWAALLTYISSLFTVSAFMAALSALERRLAPRLVATWLTAAAAVVAWLYGGFVLVFFREMVPALVAGGAVSPGSAKGAVGPLAALGRIPLFYGWGYPALAVAGFLLARRRAPPAVFRVLAAYGLAFALLISLRAFSGGLFKDLKEIEFGAGWIAACGGIALAELAAGGRPGRLAAGFVAIGLLAFSTSLYVEYVRLHTALVGLH